MPGAPAGGPLRFLIPVSAALVGWLTNWLAVEMIFWPLEWLGIPPTAAQSHPQT